MFDLKEKRQDVISVATEMFKKFTRMPKGIRPDDKESNGIYVFVWEEGTKNLLMVSIKAPDEDVKFRAIEQAVRSNIEDHYSSANSADPDWMRFPGSVSMPLGDIPGLEERINEEILTVSTSGLAAEENVAISLAILAKISELSFIEVCESIYFNNGVLPEWCLNGNKGYFDFLFE